MKHNSDFRYDLSVGIEYEGVVAQMLNQKKIEVKTDFIAHTTGNIAIEYECRGRPSGIATTESEYYVYVIPLGEVRELMVVLKVSELKKIARKYIKKGKVKMMGDNNLSKAVLLPFGSLLRGGE